MKMIKKIILGVMVLLMTAGLVQAAGQNNVYTGNADDGDFNNNANWWNTVGVNDYCYFRGDNIASYPGRANVALSADVQVAGILFQGNIKADAAYNIGGTGTLTLDATVNANTTLVRVYDAVAASQTISANVALKSSNNANNRHVYTGTGAGLLFSGTVSQASGSSGIGFGVGAGGIEMSGDIVGTGLWKIHDGAGSAAPLKLSGGGGWTGGGTVQVATGAELLLARSRTDSWGFVPGVLQIQDGGTLTLGNDEQMLDSLGIALGSCMFNLDGNKETVQSLYFLDANDSASIDMGDRGELHLSNQNAGSTWGDLTIYNWSDDNDHIYVLRGSFSQAQLDAISFDGYSAGAQVAGQELLPAELDVIVPTAYQVWSEKYGIGAETNDFDNDGVNNLCEYGLGGNPTNPADRGIASVCGIQEINETNYFSITYPAQADPNSELAYRLESTTNLTEGIWTGACCTNVYGSTFLDGNFEYVTNITTTEENQKYIRLAIESEEPSWDWGGTIPYWNANAVQFLYAPAFDFVEISGAESYLFTVTPTNGSALTFTADNPRASLSPVWANLPVGMVLLSVTGFDAEGSPVGEPMEREFHRAAGFSNLYPAPLMTWAESAQAGLSALVYSDDLDCWFSTGEPDPDVGLYRYPAKIIGAAASALAIYADQIPAPSDAAEALTAAQAAADYLLNISFSTNWVWAYHPPTYHPTMYGDLLTGNMNYTNHMTHYGAVAGEFLLDVYAATADSKYLDAAVHIAETYEANQLSEGSWTLFVAAETGTPIADNVLIPVHVVDFLDHLGEVTLDDRFEEVRDQAVAWIEQHPAVTWNWQGQFEDVAPRPPYVNLTHVDSGLYAMWLLRTAPDDLEKRTLALELLRFAEDQFVIWNQPPSIRPDGRATKEDSWLLPCVLEQYYCYDPVSGSSARVMRTYLAAYRVTGNALYLEKAKALAATLVRMQAKANGRYLTWVMDPSGPKWFNVELIVIKAMKELADCADLNSGIIQ